MFLLRSDKNPFAMATYITHILIIGKVETDNFSVSMEIFRLCFPEMCFEQSSVFYLNFVRMAYSLS